MSEENQTEDGQTLDVSPFQTRFWEARAKGRRGRAKAFKTPLDLWKACCEYFAWIEANPLYEAKHTFYQGVSDITYVPKMRAMTLSALTLFLGITLPSWKLYRKEYGEEFEIVADSVEQIIRNQKFTGAAADLLNASIISRDLGLRDQSAVITADAQDLAGETEGARQKLADALALNDNDPGQ